MSNRSPRMVRTIDADAALPLVAAVYEALYGEPLGPGVSVERQVVALAWNPEAWGHGAVDVAVIGTEGVGEYLTEEATLPITLWDKTGRSFAVPLGVNRIPFEAEPIDFAEHVRTFGSRLESNWSLWDRRMAEAQKRLAKGDMACVSRNVTERIAC